MSKVRIYELSKELNVSNKTVIEKASEFGVTVTNLSGVDADFADKLKAAILSGRQAASDEKTAKEPQRTNNSGTSRNSSETRKTSAPSQPASKNNVKTENRTQHKVSDSNNSDKRQPERLNRTAVNNTNREQKNMPHGQNSSQKPNSGQSGQRPNNNQRPNNSQNNGQRPNNSQNNGQRQNNNQTNGQRPSGGGQRPNNGPNGGQRQNNNNNNNGQNRNRNNSQQNQRNKNNGKNNQQRQKQQEVKPVPVQVQEEEELKIRKIPAELTLAELSEVLGKKTSDIVKALFLEGKVMTPNTTLDFDSASSIAEKHNVILELEEEKDIFEQVFSEEEEVDETKLKERPPVVVVMGHVDHGKTSLLDSIRHSDVTKGEAGGITQHIGAYTVQINGKPITFLDTPGHEAFTAMRMRGAQVTDVAVLVVAADDGVMPQTVEAINHAKAAGVEIIVAINKMDKPGANPDRVKQELVEYGIMAEDWGGETICVPVSAIKKTGIDTLLEMIILVAEMKELKANPDKKARGTIIEAQLDKGRGPVATVLVQDGTLNVGDPIVAGSAFGKIRAMMDDKGRRVKKAGPSTPVEILGLSEVPCAGDSFYAAENEKQARQVAESVVAKNRTELIKNTPNKVSLDDLFSQIQSGNVKELNIVVKADVQGSVEAVRQSLEKLSNDEVRVRIIHGGVGTITESDIMLASASNAIIIGFNVRPEPAAKIFADNEKVDIRLYRVIYNAIEDITAAMKGMLDPVYQEKVTGHAEIRQIYKASGVGTICGSYILDGKFIRNSKIRVIRDGIVVFEGEMESLKRFKDDVKEVNTGYECGIVIKKFNDIKMGDTLEAFIMEEVPR
ncbi:translation initiation factor IF-2 [Lachnospiraceae bacterium NSJ-143]|nr:translation initiation factor IF-2 [Lachnospiraceae bacterium NSJ-143]